MRKSRPNVSDGVGRFFIRADGYLIYRTYQRVLKPTAIVSFMIVTVKRADV